MNDLISRQAALYMIMEQPPEPHYPSWYAEQIKALPPAQQWIPVTEDTLPEEGRVVVVCGETGTWDVGKYRGYYKSNLHTNIYKWWWKSNTCKRVCWWMYKEDAIQMPCERGD